MSLKTSSIPRGERWAAAFLVALLSVVALAGPPGEVVVRELFVRGDANANGAVEITDGIAILTSLFTDRFKLPCQDAADFNDSGSLNITDGIWLLDYLFGGGLEPPPPFPFCDVDPTDDRLGCDAFEPCFVEISEIEAVRLGFGLLTTIAGKGEIAADGVNDWQGEFEGRPATAVELSGPHIALADDAGNIYIADRDAHAIRRVAVDGTITTHAGMGEPGDDDVIGPATERRLRAPNGLWVRGDGTIYVLDTGNCQVKKITVDGMMTTFLEVPGLRTGRGLWVAGDESLAYVASRTELLRWTAEEGITTLASGFSQLGNFVVERSGKVVATDRDAHRVYRICLDGSQEAIAGNGTTSGGGDGEDALATGLNQVRGIWPLEELGGYFLATQAGSQIWYLDGAGKIHLFLDGSPDGVHAGDGRPYSDPGKKVSNIRSVTRDRAGNLLITEHDAGYVRRIEYTGIAP